MIELWDIARLTEDEWGQPNDPLFRCDNLNGAQEYVSQLLEASTQKEIEEYLHIYLGTSNRPRKKARRLVGGDKEFYKLFAAIDSIHDVCRREVFGIQPCHVLATLGIRDIPAELSMKTDEDMIEYLVSVFQEPGLLCFDKTNRATNIHSFLQNVEHQNKKLDGIYNIGIPYEKESGRKLSARQLLKLINLFKKAFGTDAEFVIDNSSFLTKLVFSAKYIDECFYKSVVNSKIEPFSKFKEKAYELGTNTWEAPLTDAKLFDGIEHITGFGGFDKRPTGKVFQKGVSPNITLNGLDANYKVLFKIEGEAASFYTQAQAFADNNTTQLFRPFLFGIPKTKEHLAKPLSIKRCGDWGQVEHCKKHDKVFVTNDRFAALYAYYRGVKFVLVRDMRDRGAFMEGEENDMAQFAFLVGSGNLL